ncbi:hypothetical protein [Rhodanobacter sp. L36]|uniref:hypothetical protein n=1 Tax=Rhodanobacter sp. L36 TaxID=1747221 RepID=UPI00131DB8B5|nr:hypothetical protein [Rhodanobacter sp. L36]
MPSEPSSGLSHTSPLRHWDGALPIVMSIVVLLMVAVEVWKHGLHAPHHDEGTADHIAMLLMFGQVPIMFWFSAPGRRRIREILPTLALQLSLWVTTFALAVALT